MANYKTPSEGGSGGKRGHSNMEHWTETAELKDAARVQRRQDDKDAVEEGVAELLIPDLTAETIEDIERLPQSARSVYVIGLDDEKCATIARWLPRLQVLYQSGSPGILTDNGIACLVDLTDLQILDLEWAERITDASIAHLSRLERLSWLDLSFTGVSQSAIVQLAATLPNCEIVQ